MHATAPARPLPRSTATTEAARGLAAGTLFGAACLLWFNTTLEDAWWALVHAVPTVVR